MPTAFNAAGLLPAGDHALTLDGLRASVLVTGAGIAAWDRDWRMHLVDQLAVLCGHLWSVGVTDIFADGSFATDKARPGDIDGYFLCDYQHYWPGMHRQLLALEDAWDLGRRQPDVHGKPKPLMWHRYRVELYPQFMPPFASLTPAASDQSGAPILFPEFFRHTRDGMPRGIVRVIQETQS